LPGARSERLNRITQWAACLKRSPYRKTQIHALGWLVGVDLPLDTGDFVAKCQSLFFQPAHHEFIDGYMGGGTVNQCIEVAVFHAQLYQTAFRGVKIGFQKMRE
jgi:hypothetical protein